jgi:Lipocalin-like domain
MKRRRFFALLSGAAVLMPSSLSRAEPGSLISGAWNFVSLIDTRKDGSTVDRWGSNAKGLLMFDGAGHFTQIITGEESRIFGAKAFYAFGRYTVAGKTLTLSFDVCSIARLVGTKQTRNILALTAEELRYVNPRSSSNSVAEFLWKRGAAS